MAEAQDDVNASVSVGGASAPGSALRRYWPLAAAIVVFTVLALSYFPYTIDDTFITLRYGRHWAEGWGPAFNRAGAPVEGYTNFLWVATAAALFKSGAGPDAAVIFIKTAGVLWGVAALVALYGLTRRVFGDAAASWAAGLAAVTGFFPFWAVGGLETSQFIFLILTATWATTRITEKRRYVFVAAALWFSAALSRPEGSLIAATALAGGWWFYGRRQTGRWAATAALFLTSYGVYFVWRWDYFGFFLPNTFYARAGVSGHALARRLRGVAPLFLYLLPPVALALALKLRAVDRRSFRLVLVTMSAAAATAFAAKREWMPAFRYELPALAAATVIFGGALATFARKNRRRFSLAALALVYFFAPSVFLYKHLEYTAGLTKAHVALGRWLARAAPGATLATWDMGALPYYADSRVVYDVNPEGLLSAYTTHHRYDPEYFIARDPDFFVLFSAAADAEKAPGLWAEKFYAAPTFKNHYSYLFSFTLRPGYNLRCYKERRFELAPAWLAEGHRLAAASRGY